jgi:acetyltransferase-like isoleucine patch superfamily enzyme
MYFRGFRTYLYIRLCGGKCKGIPRIGKNVIWKYPPHSGISWGKNADIEACCFFDFPKGSSFVLGDKVKLTHNLTLAAISRIEIGDNSLIAEYTSIRDSSHGTLRNEFIN